LGTHFVGSNDDRIPIGAPKLVSRAMVPGEMPPPFIEFIILSSKFPFSI